MAKEETWATFWANTAEQVGVALTRYRHRFGQPPARALVSPKASPPVLQALSEANLPVEQHGYVMAWEVWLGPVADRRRLDGV